MIYRLTIFSFNYHGYTGIYDKMHGLTREVDTHTGRTDTLQNVLIDVFYCFTIVQTAIHTVGVIESSVTEFQIEKYQSRVGWINKSQPRCQPRLGC